MYRSMQCGSQVIVTAWTFAASSRTVVRKQSCTGTVLRTLLVGRESAREQLFANPILWCGDEGIEATSPGPAILSLKGESNF